MKYILILVLYAICKALSIKKIRRLTIRIPPDDPINSENKGSSITSSNINSITSNLQSAQISQSQSNENHHEIQ